jgi:hypothetical protein
VNRQKKVKWLFFWGKEKAKNSNYTKPGVILQIFHFVFLFYALASYGYVFSTMDLEFMKVLIILNGPLLGLFVIIFFIILWLGEKITPTNLTGFEEPNSKKQ